MKKKLAISPEQAMKQVQIIFQQRGTKALEMAKKEILQEEFESKEVRDALTYFMTQYWKDLARPSLLSLTCEAVGGKPEKTTAIAVPMILISGGIDIHDDIIDDSKKKNERQTVLGKFGKDVALVTGDILLFKGLSLLGQVATQDEAPGARLATIIGIIQKLFFELADAEALEYQYRGRVDVTPENYIQVLWRKAGDVEAHTRVSAILGGGLNSEIEALSRYGRLLGMLILLRDDWIDTLDFSELSHRIRKECLPLPILFAAQDPKIKEQIVPIIKKKNITKNDAQKILNLAKSHGFKKLGKLMKKLSKDAYSQLPQIRYNKTYLRLLIESQMLSFSATEEATTTKF
jgi:geranylgeranyl pyrophosphate synthase